MTIKIETQSTNNLPNKFTYSIERILNQVPKDHVRGIDKLKIVNQINDPRVPISQRTSLPGLYHPRQGNTPAWLEIASNTIFPPSAPFHRRIIQRISYKGNLAAILFSLIGQHYYLTMRHSLRKNQLEGAVRSYTEKQLRVWSEQQGGLRAKLFRPLQPTFEKWARRLQNRMKAEERKKKADY